MGDLLCEDVAVFEHCLPAVELLVVADVGKWAAALPQGSVEPQLVRG
jgi:hypothetical protein